MAPHAHEVVVLGGGPAGAAAATLLARRSHEVALVRPRDTPAGALAESVPPSAAKLLDELGMLEAVDGAGFHPNRGNVVWWAGQPARTEAFADGRTGYNVDRRGLEDVLVATAEKTGVRVYEAHVARSAEEPKEPGAPRSVSCERPDGSSVVLEAPWILDATGRRGLLARNEGREPDPATTTLALLGRWSRSGGWGDESDGCTLVESYADGWAWSVQLTPTLRCFSAIVDQRAEGLEGSHAAAMLDAELAKTVHVAALLDGARPEGGAWGCPSSLYVARRFGRRGLLLLGDAGSSIDPLSSFGVKKALASGWLAAVVTHTALVDPTLVETAVDFFDARERDVYRSYRRSSRPFFAEAASAYGHPFWLERAEAARAAGGEGDDHPDDMLELGEPRIPEEAVRAAFEVLRARDRLDAVPAPDLRTRREPAIEGYRVVLQDRLASAASPRGLRFFRNVDLQRVVELAPHHDQVPDVWAAYNGVAAPVTLPDFLTALSATFAAGLLVHRSGGGPGGAGPAGPG